jgi:fused signal recognition particle receptor
MGLFSKIKEGLKKTRESMSASVSAMLNSFTKIDESLFEELEEILVMGDVGVATAERICEELRRKVKEQGVKDPKAVYDLLRSIVADLLRGGEELRIGTKPSVILVIGVNGVGKTTTIGKLAAMLEKQGKKVILGAADTFRAAAIEQLEVWAQRSGAELVKQTQGSDPASVVFDSIAAAKSRGADVVICDTAGRLHNKKNLMEELAKINRVIQREAPDADREVLLVLDAATGQNAVSQAREFQAVAEITGIVLTKLDGTPKGGVILSIREELGLPVKFIGVGEQVDDLQAFDADQFAKALFERREESLDETDPGDT